MSDCAEQAERRPWYRHFWVWFLMVPPAATVIFWVVVIWTTAARPSLVVDDYSKIGLTYREQRARDDAAARLGVTARFHAVRESGGVTVALAGLPESPPHVRLLLAHPTDSSRDLETTLERGPSGIYRADLGRPLDAGRRLEVTPPDGSWRLTGRITPGQAETVLEPPGGAGGA